MRTGDIVRTCIWSMTQRRPAKSEKLTQPEGSWLKIQGGKDQLNQGCKWKGCKDGTREGIPPVNVLGQVGFPVYAGTSEASRMGGINDILEALQLITQRP